MLRRCFLILSLLGSALPVAAEVVQSAGAELAVARTPEGEIELWAEEAPVELGIPRGLAVRGVHRTSDGVLLVGSRLTGGREEIELWQVRDGSSVRLNPPPSSARNRTWPTARVEDGRLRALAWLEGDDTFGLSVRAAERDAAGWSTTEVVSRPGPGSQLALRSAVLADGSWLLVWSAFDGEDDEIVWSLRSADSWSAVRPVHAGNAVPDIVPAVAALGRGAIAAWASFDGEDYRLRLARFESGRWSPLGWRGEKGSAFPSFTRLADGVRVLYQAAEPLGWYVVDVGEVGEPLRSGWTPSERESRPHVGRGSGSQVELSWSDAARERRAVEWRGADPRSEDER